MSAASRLRVAWRVLWRVLRAEGAAAVRDRARDRLAEAARRRPYSSLPPDWRPEEPIPVLLVTATPPVPWLGGVQTQLRSRLEDEVRGRSIALLFNDGDAWRLEIRSGADRFFLDLPGSRPSPEALEDAAFEAAVRRAAERIGARAVHVEGIAGLPLASLLRLGQGGLTLLLTLHDFAALHPAPHRVASPLAEGFQEGRREIAAGLLAAARAVVFPSEFLRRAHLGLFPGLPEDRTHILEPPLASTVALPRRLVASPGPILHVALVGSVQPHKGAAVFAEVVRRLSGAGLRWSSYGGGDAPLLRDLRRLGVRVRGYYRSGSLPGLLRRDAVDLVLLLSVIPESYSLTLGECVVAGVPVIAFGSGALAERVPRLGAGRVVDPARGAEGITEALGEGGSLPAIPEDAVHLLSDPVSAAAGHLALYRELQLL